MPTPEWRERNKEKMRAYRRVWYKKNKEHAKKKIYERRKEIQRWFRGYKATLHCIQCGEDHPACLVFHHRDLNEKDFSIAHMLTGYGKKRILEEIAKCDVLCANCHRKLHWELKH